MSNQTMEKQDEQKSVEVENKTVATVVTVPVKKPITIDGVSIDSIKLDFSEMTGADILKVDEELRLEGLSFNNLYDPRVLLKLSSRGAKIIQEDLQRLHAADFTEVIFSTRNFFLTW